MEDAWAVRHFPRKPEWHLPTWGQESSNIFFWKPWRRGSILIILLFKAIENNSFYWVIFFAFPPVSYSNKEMHEVKWKYFIMVCNQPFVKGSLKNGSTGLSTGKIVKVLGVWGQPRMTLEKILTLIVFAYLLKN